jgi:hypothetical protein
LSGRTAAELNLAFAAAAGTSATSGTLPVRAGLDTEGTVCSASSAKLKIEASIAKSATEAADANASPESEGDLTANAAATSAASAALEGKVNYHLALVSCYAKAVPRVASSSR